MPCPHCNAPTANEARYCGACGKAISATEPSDAGVSAASLMLGREIAGRYRIVSKLGEGGMGAVFRAEQISLKRAVAVKLLRPEVAASPLLLRRFNAEAEAVAKLSHPNTVNIYDFGQDTDGTLFIAMEYIEGTSLRSVIHREAPLPLRRSLAIVSQVAASLVDAHGHSIVHRDLKPDNVMLQERGRMRDVVRVLDFGIAKLRDENRATQMAMTQAGDMLGTPAYMAPEQIRAEHVDGRTDIYALGCMLYEMITGRMPHDAPTVMALLSKHLLDQPVPPSQRRPDLGLSPQVDHLIMSAMAKEPSARPPTMELFGEQIAAVMATLPDDGPRPTQGSVASPSVPMGTPQLTPMAASRAAPQLTPMAPSGVQPHGDAPGYAPAPHGSAAPPYSPHYSPAPVPAMVTPPITTTPAGSDRRSLYIVLAVIAIAGIGVALFAVWFTSLDDSAKARDAGPDHWAPSDDNPEPPTPTGEDPWAAPAKPSPPPPPTDDPWQ
ncbi:MAG: protein kinase [Kofleriaceae bacterium]